MASTPSLLSRLGPPVSQKQPQPIQEKTSRSRPRDRTKRTPNNRSPSPSPVPTVAPNQKPKTGASGSAASMWATPAPSRDPIQPSTIKKASTPDLPTKSLPSSGPVPQIPASTPVVVSKTESMPVVTKKVEKEVDSATRLLGQLALRQRQAAASTPKSKRGVAELGVAREQEGRKLEELPREDKPIAVQSPVSRKPAEENIQKAAIFPEQDQASGPTAEPVKPSTSELQNPVSISPRKVRDWAADEDDEDEEDLGLEEWGYSAAQIMNRKVSPTTSRKPSFTPAPVPPVAHIPVSKLDESTSRWATPQKRPAEESKRKEKQQQTAPGRLARLGMPVR